MSSPSPRSGPPRVRSTEHLEILNEIARISTGDLDLDSMLQRVTDSLRSRFGWDYVSCMSVDRARGLYRCEALSTELPTEVHVGYSREIGSGVVGEVALTGHAVLLDDVGEHPAYVETQPGTRSELCVPILHRGETVALLNLESQRPRAFHDQLPLLETVAEQVAGAIASARLHEELQQRARLLEMVGEVSKAAMDAGELGLLLDRVVEYIRERFPLILVSILMVDLDEGVFTQSAHAGHVHPHVLRGARWPVMRGVSGRAVRTGEPQLVPDVRADPDYLAVVEDAVAEYAVPIVYRGEVLGVLNMETDRADVFTPEIQTVFRTFADQLAGAIHMAAVNQELEEMNDRLTEANQRLERLSQLDGLTGIANRRAFDAVLETEWRRAGRERLPLSLLMIDIDLFKDFNDRHGHQGGDDALRAVAATPPVQPAARGGLRGAVWRRGVRRPPPRPGRGRRRRLRRDAPRRRGAAGDRARRIARRPRGHHQRRRRHRLSRERERARRPPRGGRPGAVRRQARGAEPRERRIPIEFYRFFWAMFVTRRRGSVRSSADW